MSASSWHIRGRCGTYYNFFSQYVSLNCASRPDYEPAGDPEDIPQSFCADGCAYDTKLRGSSGPNGGAFWIEATPTGEVCMGGGPIDEEEPPRDDPPCVETPNGLVCVGEDGPCAESESGIHCVDWEDAPACDGPFCVGPPDDQHPPENPPPAPDEPYGEEPPESGTASNQPPPPGVDPPCTGAQACFWNWDFHPEPEPGGGGGPGGGEPCVGEDCPEPCTGEDCEPCTGEDCGGGSGEPGGPGGPGSGCVGEDCPEPCTGDDCPEPCVGDDCGPCVGDDCEPCVGDDCEPCTGDDCGGGQAGGGATCGAAPTCSGDAVGCAILRQAWETRCAVERLGQGSDEEEAPGLEGNPQDHSGTVEIGTAMLDTGGFAGGGGSCPEWGPLEILGHTFTLPQPHCNLILWFGYLLVASATFVAGRIIAGG